MKTKLYLLTTIMIMSFWLGLKNASGNQVIQKKDTLVYLHNVKTDSPVNVSVKRDKVTMDCQSLVAKIDTTQDDYIFISARILAADLNLGRSNYRSVASCRIVNEGPDLLEGVYYFDPEGNRVRI